MATADCGLAGYWARPGRVVGQSREIAPVARPTSVKREVGRLRNMRPATPPQHHARSRRQARAANPHLFFASIFILEAAPAARRPGSMRLHRLVTSATCAPPSDHSAIPPPLPDQTEQLPARARQRAQARARPRRTGARPIAPATGCIQSKGPMLTTKVPLRSPIV